MLKSLKVIKKKINFSKDANIADLEKSISDKMGLTVTIKNTKKNSGTITLTYKEIDQLNKIVDILKTNY